MQPSWSRFRSIPVWAQALVWVVALPFVAALFLASKPSKASKAAGAAVAVVFGTSWLVGISAPSGTAPTVEETAPEREPTATVTATETVTEVVPASPSPRASPSSSPAASPTATATAAPSGGGGASRPARTAATTWTVVDVVDGDTIDVRNADGVRERVRIIGIDTPERGACGFAEASQALSSRVLGRTVELEAGARDDRDRYGRILRYVDVGTVDAGLSLIEQGYAVARYDSRDGYGRHPREDTYVAADAASEPSTCSAPRPAPEPADTQRPASNPWGTSSCHAAYDPCVPPPSETGDLDCPDVREHHPDGVSVDHAHGDPHGLDGDEDGWGCD